MKDTMFGIELSVKSNKVLRHKPKFLPVLFQISFFPIDREVNQSVRAENSHTFAKRKDSP